MSRSIPHVAEDVLPGHPDRLGDAVAERCVDAAVALDEGALAGVEVAVFRRGVVITGRIAAGRAGELERVIHEGLVRDAYAAAGYAGESWAIDPRILFDLELGPLSDAERGIRGFSDDQNVVIGHAVASEATGWLPPAAFAARRLRGALAQVRNANASVLGPDGKVLVRLVEERDAFRWDVVNLAVQHAEGVGYEALHRLVLPALEAEAKLLDAALPGLGASFDASRVRLNGGGDFSCGGPFGDNGLSGKKLVVDHYGPGAPIGGGALCGKDPHKVDRVGALRARQLAVRLVRDAGAREATVRLGFLPGLREPAFLDARVDGRWWDRRRVERAIAVPDLSLAGSFRDLDLASVRWSEVLAGGYFGGGWVWER
jgi:S-adenosylmethionine synthetase